ncbi:hypothetical protein D1007_20211 [Hordeum vulgare]|nr:hypothetical protein D1007_20211 [Hordeum vulgare]
MENFCRQYPELGEADKEIIAEHGREVILITDDDVQGNNDGDEDEKKFNDEKWRSIFPNYDEMEPTRIQCTVACQGKIGSTSTMAMMMSSLV